MVPLVPDVGVAELHVVKELFLEVLEHHAVVFHLDEVHDPVRPRVLVWAEGEEHVEVVGALVHLVAGLPEVVGAGVPKALAAGVLDKHPVGLEGFDEDPGELGVDDALLERVVHVDDRSVEPKKLQVAWI